MPFSIQTVLQSNLPPGAQGAQGSQGVQGSTGTQGFQGVQGSTGPTGPAGGPQGAQGVQGAPGPQGSAGSPGPQGVQGATGSPGAQGAQGAQGAAGTTLASGINYSQGGTGAVTRTVETRLRDLVSVKDFGAVGNGIADDTTAIQAALDASSGVFLPNGVYKITSTLNFNDDNFLYGQGYNSRLYAPTLNAAVIKGKSVTQETRPYPPYTGTRRYRGGGRDFAIEGPAAYGSGYTSSIGLDMRGCSQFKWSNVKLTRMYYGVRQGNDYSTYYNEYYGVDISSVYYGYHNQALSNDNLVSGGRVNDFYVGTYDEENSHNKYIGMAMETFVTAAHQLGPSTPQYNSYLYSRIENNSTGTGFLINSSAQFTYILYPTLITLGTKYTMNGVHVAGQNTHLYEGEKIYLNMRPTNGDKITANSNLYIANGNISFDSGYGIDFSANGNATGVTSEVLDDYEYGTFTPVLTQASSAPTIGYTQQQGKYVKIGRMVFVTISVIISSASGGSGANQITGLPFPNNDSQYTGQGAVGFNDGFVNTVYSSWLFGGGTTMYFKSGARGSSNESGGWTPGYVFLTTVYYTNS